jgi:hypothetical protein
MNIDHLRCHWSTSYRRDDRWFMIWVDGGIFAPSISILMSPIHIHTIISTCDYVHRVWMSRAIWHDHRCDTNWYVPIDNMDMRNFPIFRLGAYGYRTQISWCEYRTSDRIRPQVPIRDVPHVYGINRMCSSRTADDGEAEVRKSLFDPLRWIHRSSTSSPYHRPCVAKIDIIWLSTPPYLIGAPSMSIGFTMGPHSPFRKRASFVSMSCGDRVGGMCIPRCPIASQ